MDRLASLVIDGYDAEKSTIPRCNASSCGAEVGLYLEESGTLDFRLNSEICAQLDWQALPDRLAEMERKSWEDYRWKKHQLKKEALGLMDKVAKKKSMRAVGRSSEEQKEARERHLRVVENF